MFKKLLLIGLLGISLVLLANESLALVCPGGKCAYSIGGTCLKCATYTKCIECNIYATGLGNCEGKSLGCTAHGVGTWVVACGNPGSKNWEAPGIQTVYFEGTISGSIGLTAKDCDKNGNAQVKVVAEPSQELKDALKRIGVCNDPNPQWIVGDAVPCVMMLEDIEVDENGCPTAVTTWSCTLPNCDTLGWDPHTHSFERRQYDCYRMEILSLPCK